MATNTTMASWFWAESFWLPKQMKSWDEMVSRTPGVYYPKLEDIVLQTIGLGFVFIVVRFVYERILVIPFAKHLGIKPKQEVKVEKNEVLEQIYTKNKIPSDEVIQGLSKKTNLTERQVQRWFRHKRNNDAPGRMKKFCECSWHLLFYCTSFWYGVYVLWDKPWLWKPKLCWDNCPLQHISNDIYLYYLVELGFYWNLVFSTLYDHKRKDFLEMSVHHVATILLIVFSWSCNFVRIGTLVLLAHDASDYWMAAAKMSSYSKRNNFAEGFFVLFIVTWILSRLVWYPFWILWSVWFEAEIMFGVPAFFLFFGLLMTLQVLHIIWSYMIARIIANKFIGDGKVRDVRSDTEGSDEEEEVKMEETADAKHSKPVSNRRSRMKHRA